LRYKKRKTIASTSSQVPRVAPRPKRPQQAVVPRYLILDDQPSALELLQRYTARRRALEFIDNLRFHVLVPIPQVLDPDLGREQFDP